MDRARLVNAVLVRKSLLVAGIGALIGVLATAPESHAPASLLRATLVLSCMLTVLVLSNSGQRWHTLTLWASIGATMGSGLEGLFGIGPVGLIPFVLVIAYAVLSRDELDYGLTLTGGIVSAILFVLVAVPVQQLI